MAVLTGIACLCWPTGEVQAEEVYLRANQLGYRPEDVKVAVAFAATSTDRRFAVADWWTGRSTAASSRA